MTNRARIAARPRPEKWNYQRMMLGRWKDLLTCETPQDFENEEFDDVAFHAVRAHIDYFMRNPNAANLARAQYFINDAISEMGLSAVWYLEDEGPDRDED